MNGQIIERQWTKLHMKWQLKSWYLRFINPSKTSMEPENAWQWTMKMDLIFSGDSGKETIISRFVDVVSDSSIGCRDFQFWRVLPLSVSSVVPCCPLAPCPVHPFPRASFSRYQSPGKNIGLERCLAKHIKASRSKIRLQLPDSLHVPCILHPKKKKHPLTQNQKTPCNIESTPIIPCVFLAPKPSQPSTSSFRSRVILFTRMLSPVSKFGWNLRASAQRLSSGNQTLTWTMNQIPTLIFRDPKKMAL